MAERNVRLELDAAKKRYNNIQFEVNGLREKQQMAQTRMGYEEGLLRAAARDKGTDSAAYRNKLRTYNEAKARFDELQAQIDALTPSLGQAKNQMEALAAEAKAATEGAQEKLRQKKEQEKKQRESADAQAEANALRKQAQVERDLGNPDAARKLESDAAARERDAAAAVAPEAPAPAAPMTAAHRRRGADVTPTAAPTGAAGATGATPAAGTTTTTTGPTGTTTKTKPAATTTPTAPATPKGKKTPAATTALTEEQRSRLGTYGSKYLIDYFKSSPKYKYIYDYLVQAARGNYDDKRVQAWLKDQNWYKDVNERVKAPIYASGLANGIKLTDPELDAFRDQDLAGVLDPAEIANRLRQRAIKDFNLARKPEIARALQAGKNLDEALADYAGIYQEDLGLSATQFDVGDQNFLNKVMSATSLDDFRKKVRRDERFLSKQETQLAISQNVSQLKQQYAQFGMKIGDAEAQRLAQQVYLGDTTQTAIQDNLRQIAANTFQPFRDRILNGEDPLTIATPYISAMSRILEVPNGALDLEDPTVRKAMMGVSQTKGETTTHTATPLWEFEQQLYRDNRWQYTANARATLDQVSLDVLSRFGMIG